MAAIITRSTAGTGAIVKNSTLTNIEVDTNFINLNTDIQTRLLKTGDTNLYLGAAASPVRFPNTISVSSDVTSAGSYQSESHQIGTVSERMGLVVTKTIITGSSGGNTLTLNNVSGIYINQAITGTGIHPKATITNINTGTNVITLSRANIGTPTGSAYILSYGIGLYGIGYTNSKSNGIGAVGEAHVNSTSDTGSAIGVKGYSFDAHSGGANIGLYGSAENGNVNYSLYLDSGDVYSASTSNKTWWLNSNLSFANADSNSYSVTIPQLVLGTDLAIQYGGTGASSFTPNCVLLGNGSSSFQTVAPGAAGDLLVSNGSTWTTEHVSLLVNAQYIKDMLGYTPYNASNPNGYISGMNGDGIVTALGYTPFNAAHLPSGTRMTFQQSNAPTGWTKDTNPALNDSLLRIVIGNVSSGGVNAFSSFNGQTSVGATTLSTSQIPSHNHGASSSATSSASTNASSTISDPGHQHVFGGDDQIVYGGYNSVSGFSYDAKSSPSGGGRNFITKRIDNTNNPQTTGITVATTVSVGVSTSVSTSISNTGGGESHSHSLTTNVKYFDCVIATKD
jgi:hypothetical protein